MLARSGAGVRGRATSTVGARGIVGLGTRDRAPMVGVRGPLVTHREAVTHVAWSHGDRKIRTSYAPPQFEGHIGSI